MSKSPKKNKGSNSTHEVSELKVHHSIKHQAYKDHVKNIRSGLSKPDRIHSYFAHHPSIEWLLELLSQLLIRPTAILVGAFFSVVISGVSIYYAKHLGYSFNYLLPLISFALGYVLESLIEILVRALT